MSKYTEEELNQALEDTGRLLQDVPLTREYDLDDILAEFGTGEVKPQQPRPEPVSQSQQPEPEDPAAEPAPKPESIAEKPAEEEAPAEQPKEDTRTPEKDSPEIEEKAAPREHLVSLEDMMDRTVSAVMEEESAQRQLEREEQERQARRARRAALCRARLAAVGRFLRALAAPKARPEPEPEGGRSHPPGAGHGPGGI